MQFTKLLEKEQRNVRNALVRRLYKKKICKNLEERSHPESRSRGSMVYEKLIILNGLRRRH